jgi:hypothetical protein
MPNTYLDQTGLNTRRAIPTSRLGTRNLVWYSFFIEYDLLHGELEDGYMAYDSSDSFYHWIVEAIQEAAELYHLGAPTNLNNYGFLFAIADNDGYEPDPDFFTVGYGGGEGGGPGISSVYQALTQRLGPDQITGWALAPCADQGRGIIYLS